MADELDLTEEQRDLRRTVHSFLAEHSDEASVRQLMESELGHDPGVWRRLGRDLGVLGLMVPEEAGGAGGTPTDQAVVAEEAGAALLTGPLVGTVGLAVPALAALSDVAARDELLPDLLDGARTAALVLPAASGRVDPDEVTVTESGGRLEGLVRHVVDGTADLLLVAARTSGGIGLFATTDADRRPMSTMDLTRRRAEVRLTSAPARLLAGPDEAPLVLAHALASGATLLAAEQAGASARLLRLSVEYASTRRQFGRTIGSFQAVKHRCADMLVEVEHARAAAYHAAAVLGGAPGDPALAASIAQAVCSPAFQRVASLAVQVHGGIGFTWEHVAHLFYKRAVTDAALLGSAAHHRDHVATAVLDTARPSGLLAVAGVG